MKQVKKTIAKLALKGDNAYTVKDLAMHIYDIGLDGIERRHTIPVVRAMKQLVEEHPQLDIHRDWGYGKGRPMIILDTTSPIAWAIQRAKHDSYGYNRVYPSGYVDPDATEAALIKGIKKKELKKGGNCYRFAKMAKAKIGGDEAKIAECEKEQAEAVATIIKSAPNAPTNAPTLNVSDAIKAMKILYEYHLTMDNDDGLTYAHEGKQLAFRIEELPE